MKKPLFEIGETVVLESRDLPQHNGEYTVQKICIPNVRDEYGFKDSVFSYHLGFEYIFSGEIGGYFHEAALRKKHKPSELSFQELVSSLNTPIKA